MCTPWGTQPPDRAGDGERPDGARTRRPLCRSVPTPTPRVCSSQPSRTSSSNHLGHGPARAVPESDGGPRCAWVCSWVRWGSACVDGRDGRRCARVRRVLPRADAERRRHHRPPDDLPRLAAADHALRRDRVPGEPAVVRVGAAHPRPGARRPQRRRRLRGARLGDRRRPSSRRTCPRARPAQLRRLRRSAGRRRQRRQQQRGRRAASTSSPNRSSARTTRCSSSRPIRPR